VYLKAEWGTATEAFLNAAVRSQAPDKMQYDIPRGRHAEPSYARYL